MKRVHDDFSYAASQNGKKRKRMKVEERLFDDASAEVQRLPDAKKQSQHEIRELKALILDCQHHVCILSALCRRVPQASVLQRITWDLTYVRVCGGSKTIQ